MDTNQYLKKLLERASSIKASILLPESYDERVKKATSQLNQMGFNILNVNDFTDNQKYFDFISSQKFTDNWPVSEIENYLNDPVNKALTILACDDVDGVISFDVSFDEVYENVLLSDSSVQIIGSGNINDNGNIFYVQ